MENLIAEINANLDSYRIKNDDDVHYKMTCLVEEHGEFAEAIIFNSNIEEECADKIVVLMQFLLYYEKNAENALKCFHEKSLEAIIRNINSCMVSTNHVHYKLTVYSMQQGKLAHAILENEEISEHCSDCILTLIEILKFYEKDSSKVIEYIYNSAKKLK